MRSIKFKLLPCIHLELERNRVQQVRQWDWRALFILGTSVTLKKLYTETETKDQRFKKQKSRLHKKKEKQAYKVSRSTGVSNI